MDGPFENQLSRRAGPPRSFRGAVAKLQIVSPCVCDHSEQKGHKARESGETES